MSIFKKIGKAAKGAVKDVGKAAKAVVKVDEAIVKDVGKAATVVAKDTEKVAKVVAKDTVAAAKVVAKDAVKVAKAAWNLNPVGELLRNGFLLLMKINLFNVAGRFKYAYLTDAEAVTNGIDPTKLNGVRHTLITLQKLFYDAGGGGLSMNKTTSNDTIRNAILKGSGNKHGLKVSGDGSPTGGGVPTSFDGGGTKYSESNYYVGKSNRFVGSQSNYVGGDYSNVAGVDDAAEATATGGTATLAATLDKIGDITSKISKIGKDVGNTKSSLLGSSQAQAQADFANQPANTGAAAQDEINTGLAAENELKKQVVTQQANPFNNPLVIAGIVVGFIAILGILQWKYKFVKI